MRAVPLAAGLVLAAACSTSPERQAPAPAPQAPQDKEQPPVAKTPEPPPPTLPPPGEAPPAVVAGDAIAPIWDAPLATLGGEPTTLGAFRGQAVMVVNVASRCGLTPQYEQLEALHKVYAPKGFTVVGFPCNQFGEQEPGTAEEIREFCSMTYGVTFPMMEKVEVNGPGRHPVYDKLTAIADASGHTGDIRWNFEKFVISADGARVTRFSPRTRPDDPAVIAAVEQALP